MLDLTGYWEAGAWPRFPISNLLLFIYLIALPTARLDNTSARTRLFFFFLPAIRSPLVHTCCSNSRYFAYFPPGPFEDAFLFFCALLHHIFASFVSLPRVTPFRGRGGAAKKQRESYLRLF